MGMGPDSVTRPSLLLRLGDARDDQSWATFVDVYGPLVFGHCRRRSLQHADAEDVTQKVFAQVSLAIRRFEYDPQAGRFRDWLGTIVRNEVNRFLRKQSRDGANSNEALDQVEARQGSGRDEGFFSPLFPEAVQPTPA